MCTSLVPGHSWVSAVHEPCSTPALKSHRGNIKHVRGGGADNHEQHQCSEAHTVIDAALGGNTLAPVHDAHFTNEFTVRAAEQQHRDRTG